MKNANDLNAMDFLMPAEPAALKVLFVDSRVPEW
jgi:hypothetical protein